jgi:hypothetical protein
VNAEAKYSNGESSFFSDWEFLKGLDDGEFTVLKAPVSALMHNMLEDIVSVESVWIREAQGNTFELAIPRNIKDRIQV